MRSAAAEADIQVTQSQPELRALVTGLRMLCERGILSELDGRVDDLMDGELDPPVLLRIHHARLLQMLPRSVPLDDEGQWECDPGQDPQGWLHSLHRDSDPGLRVCGMLEELAAAHDLEIRTTAAPVPRTSASSLAKGSSSCPPTCLPRPPSPSSTPPSPWTTRRNRRRLTARRDQGTPRPRPTVTRPTPARRPRCPHCHTRRPCDHQDGQLRRATSRHPVTALVC
ncbi:DUF2398 family protein [Streptomyces sp. 3212.3]|uniref:DUF2398 family protein n=1 Tax=Streptomyces sp. MI02-2A TaxID=3028688 RepID=UPI0015F255BD